MPVFVLGGESGRLFKPLAFTKTFAMAAAAVLSITIIPVLMVYFITTCCRSVGSSRELGHHYRWRHRFAGAGAALAWWILGRIGWARLGGAADAAGSAEDHSRGTQPHQHRPAEDLQSVFLGAMKFRWVMLFFGTCSSLPLLAAGPTRQ
jgi:multidrug efflux pump subunit AcrB